MKKTITVMLAFLMILLDCAAGRNGLSANAAYDNWKEAYAAFLTKSIVRETVEDPTFSLIYLNDDEIPELVVSTKSMCHADSGELYTFYNGQIVDLDGYGSWGEFLYTEREGYILSSYSGSGITSQTVYQMEGATVREIVSFEDDEAMDLETVTCYINDDPVPNEEYADALQEWESRDWRSSGFDYYLNEANIKQMILQAKDEETTKPRVNVTDPVEQDETEPQESVPAVIATEENTEQGGNAAPDEATGEIREDETTRKSKNRDADETASGRKNLILYLVATAAVVAALCAVLAVLILKGRKTK